MEPTANDPRFLFIASPSLEELLQQQGKRVINDLSVLHGGWLEDEPIEDFLAALREWRGGEEGGPEPPRGMKAVVLDTDMFRFLSKVIPPLRSTSPILRAAL